MRQCINFKVSENEIFSCYKKDDVVKADLVGWDDVKQIGAATFLLENSESRYCVLVKRDEYENFVSFRSGTLKGETKYVSIPEHVKLERN